MDGIAELAFEFLRITGRLLIAILQAAIESLRSASRLLFEVFFEIFADAIAPSCVRTWRRFVLWVGKITGLPALAIPLSVLLVIALAAGAFVIVVWVGQAIFV